MKIRPLTYLAQNKGFKRIVDWSSKNSGFKTRNNENITNLQLVKKHFPTGLTAVLSGLFIADTLRSKEIPKDKKRALLKFYVINALVIIAGTYAVMPSVEAFTKRLSERFEKLNKNVSEYATLQKGLKSMIPIVAICIVSRIISPVIASWFSKGEKK